MIEQRDLFFDHTRSSIDKAKAAGATAAAACSDAAERRGWDRDGARTCVLEYIRANGPCTGEKAVDHAKQAGFIPHNDRAFGAVFQSLSRSGAIFNVGYAPRAKGHGAPGASVWKANP